MNLDRSLADAKLKYSPAIIT